MRKISAIGGVSASDLWCQIQADVFDTEVFRLDGYSHGAAVGAGMIAEQAVGLWNNLCEAAEMQTVLAQFEPIPANVTIYKDMFNDYKTFFPALDKAFVSSIKA